MSLGSNSAKGRGLTEKLAEMETYRTIVCKQIENLQAFLDQQGAAASGKYEKILGQSLEILSLFCCCFLLFQRADRLQV